jgi:hypothetical protein
LAAVAFEPGSVGLFQQQMLPVPPPLATTFAFH